MLHFCDVNMFIIIEEIIWEKCLNFGFVLLMCKA